MKSRKAQDPNQITERRARILSFRPQENAWNPTLEECLAMEAEEARRKKRLSLTSWERLEKDLQDIRAIAAEIQQARGVTA